MSEPAFDPDAERPCSCEETERLRAELWHVCFLSLMRAQMAAEWARLLDEERTAHAKTRTKLERFQGVTERKPKWSSTAIQMEGTLNSEPGRGGPG